MAIDDKDAPPPAVGIADSGLGDGNLQRPSAGGGLNDAPGQTLVHVTRPACAQLFLLYGSRQGGVPTHFLQRARLAGRNLVLLRDPWDANFERGVGPNLPDYDALIEWQRAHIASLPHVREVHTLGFSSGGFAALLFGHLLGVKASWAFSPRSGRAASGGAASAGALLRATLAKGSGAVQHNVYFAPGNETDLNFCKRLEPLPGVTLHPRAELGDTHESMRDLALSGQLAVILPPYLRADPGPDMPGS